MKRTIIQSISFQADVYEKLNKLKNVSKFVNEAVRYYLKVNSTKELKRKMIREQKRELARKMAILGEEEKRLK